MQGSEVGEPTACVSHLHFAESGNRRRLCNPVCSTPCFNRSDVTYILRQVWYVQTVQYLSPPASPFGVHIMYKTVDKMRPTPTSNPHKTQTGRICALLQGDLRGFYASVCHEDRSEEHPHQEPGASEGAEEKISEIIPQRT